MTGSLDQHGQRVVRNEHIELFTAWHHSVGSIEKEMETNARLIAMMHNALPALIECVKFLEMLSPYLDERQQPGEMWAALGCRQVLEALDKTTLSGPND